MADISLDSKITKDIQGCESECNNHLEEEFNKEETKTQDGVSVNQTKPPVKPKPNISKFILNRIRNADFKNTTVRYSSQSTLSRITGENDERTTQSMFIESTNDSDFTNLKNETRNTVIVAEVEEKEEELDKAKNNVAINEDVKICESIVNEENVNKEVNVDEKNDVNEEITETYEVSETVLEDSTCDVADVDTCIDHTGDEHPYANIDFSLDNDNVYVNLEPGCQFANQCSSAKRNSQEPSNKLPIPPPRRSKSLLEQASKTNEKKQMVKKTKKTSPIHIRKVTEKRQQHCVEHSQSLPEGSQFLQANHNSIVDPERPYSNIRPTPIRRQKKIDKSNKEISYAESAKRESNRTSSSSPVEKRKEKMLSSVKKNKSKSMNESSKRQRTISANSALDPKLVENDSPEKSKPPVKPKPPKRKSRKERSKTMTPVVSEQVLGKENDTDNARSSTLTAPPRKNRSKSVEVVSKDTLDLPSSTELKIKPMPELSSKESSENTKGSIDKTNCISGNPTRRTKKQKSQGTVVRPCRPAPPPPVKSKSCDSANLAAGTLYSKVNDATYAVVNKNRKENVSKSKTDSGIKGEGSDTRLPSTPHKVISDLHTFSFPSDIIDSTKVVARMSAEIEASAGPEVTDIKENALEPEVLENATVEQLKSPLSRDNSGSSGRGSFHSSENRTSGEGNRNSGLSDDYVLPDIKPLDTKKGEQIYVNQVASPDLQKKITYPSPILGTRSIPMKPNEIVDDQSEIEQQDGYEDMSKFARKHQNIYSVPRACNHTPTEDGKCECAEFTDSSGDEDGGSLSDEIEEYGNYEPINELTQSGKHTVENVEMTPEHRRKVLLVANEVRDSERVFVDVLKLLNEDFRSAIEHASFNTSRPVIDDKVLDQILGQLPQLQMFNEDLLDDLDKRIEEWDDNPRLADIFLKKGPYLKLYTTYIRDFERLCAIFDEACTKYSFFGQVVRDFEASPRCMHLALKHYMLKPIQRIPQYKLLLTDYLKKLNPDCEDYSDTQAALKIVSEVANHANETMRQGDNFEKLLQIQHSLMGNHEIVKPGRIFKKEGILLKLSRKVMQPRSFFLMSDCLLYTTPYPSGQYKLNNELSLAGMKVSRPVQEDFQNEFSIISVQRSFTLSANTPELRDEWIDALMTAITDYAQKKSSFNLMRPNSVTESNLMSLGRKAPVWIPDGRVTMCMICTCEFTITWRRHHCRACGKVVCGNCSDNKLPLSYLSSKVARCCDECYSCLKEDCPEEEEKEDEALNKMTKKKKNTTNKKKIKANRKMSRPSALKEVAANECNITMSGYLFQKGAKKQWKKYWYVIKDKVLYTYKASEDVAALESMPLLGYDIRVINEYYEGVEAGLVLQLFHQGRQIRMFRTESKVATEKWRYAMHSATIL